EIQSCELFLHVCRLNPSLFARRHRAHQFSGHRCSLAASIPLDQPDSNHHKYGQADARLDPKV
ncbi:hypothetical protein, partial [Xanthomonas campestris]